MKISCQTVIERDANHRYTIHRRGNVNLNGTQLSLQELWRNGKYTDLNDKNLISKPDNVTITKAIDLASNGFILVQATEGGIKKTGILLPIELSAIAGKVHHGFDPPTASEGDPADIYWASVVKDKTNTILKLRNPLPAAMEWKISQGDETYVDISPKTFTQETTSLTLTGKGNPQSATETTIKLVPLGKTGPVAITLKVLVMPQRQKQIAIYRIEDSGAPQTQFSEAPAVELPSNEEILEVCNDCFIQAGVNFTLHPSSGDYNYPYDTRGFTEHWRYSASAQSRASDGKLDNREQGALFDDFEYSSNNKENAAIDDVVPIKLGDANVFRVFIIKESGIPYGEEYPGLMIRGFAGNGLFAKNLQRKLQISIAAAHEIGHVLKLSRPRGIPGGDDEGGHDQPPYSYAVAQDHPNNLFPVHPGNSPFLVKIAPNRALMQAGTPESEGLPWVYGRWMCKKDWELANTSAK